MSDVSWGEGSAGEALRKFQKGDELETVILAIDAERERISLGLKQLADDPIANYLGEHEKGSVVTGKVLEVDAKSATVELAPGVLGNIRAAEIAQEKVEDARTRLNVGDTIEAKIMGTDRKTHTVTLSMKSKDSAAQPKKAAASRATKKKDKSADAPLKATLGDLFKAKINGESDKE